MGLRWALFVALLLSPAPALAIELPHPDMPRALPLAQAPSAQPACATEHAFHVLWVLAPSTLDTFEARAPQIRAGIAMAAGIVRASAIPHGVDVRLRFLCDDAGEVIVEKVRVPTRPLAADFTTIVRDLQEQGYDDPQRKYWVVYEAPLAGCGGCVGQGHVRWDDRLHADNANNLGGVYAVTYVGNFGPSGNVALALSDTMLHEAAHTMGAVQLSAPHSSGAWHCNDGADVMCYADGAQESDFTPLACPRLVVTEVGAENAFDCGNDDYFHPAPPAESYLATRWNVGSPLNRYIEWRALT